MKKLIIILFVLFSQITFSQKKDFQKHNFLFNFGVGHSNNWKDVFYEPNDRIVSFAHQGLMFETLYPGYFKKPTFYINSDFNYYYNLNSFILIAGLNYFHGNLIKETSLDSINKYYLFSDSIKSTLAYYEQNSPLFSSKKSNDISLNIAIGYKLWNLELFFGVKYNIISYIKIEKHFIENIIYNKDYTSFFEKKPLLYSRLNYYFNDDFPVSAYIELSSHLSLGCQFKFK